MDILPYCYKNCANLYTHHLWILNLCPPTKINYKYKSYILKIMYLLYAIIFSGYNSLCNHPPLLLDIEDVAHSHLINQGHFLR